MGRKQPIPILPDKYSKPVELLDVFISNIADKKKTSDIVKKLSKLAPLDDDFPHLKRVKSPSPKSPLQIILCKTGIGTDGNKNSKNYDDILSHISSIEGLSKPYCVKVPSHAPLTRQQFEEASKYWPINFHEDKMISSLLSGNHFSCSDIQEMEKYMVAAIKMAKAGAAKGQLPIGAIVVDPVAKIVIAEAFDLRASGYPLQHAVMVAIDLVAHSQGGGMWSFTDPELYHKAQESCGVKKDLPYLCTSYDLYITQEPCAMCSMALVHSRIARVFYGSSMIGGTLGSELKIHCHPGLNHHYDVFAGILHEETDALYSNTDG